MKTLETMKEEIFRFRCSRCRSKFEMTKQEREENDWEYGEHEKGGRYDYPHNPVDHFYCPVCGKVETMDRQSIHRYFIMDSGREVQDY
jgi:predicted RNA-binding Zn-ribbon protein involved in translation (DUF1610 family)